MTSTYAVEIARSHLKIREMRQSNAMLKAAAVCFHQGTRLCTPTILVFI
jgi:hypothetical protein